MHKNKKSLNEMLKEGFVGDFDRRVEAALKPVKPSKMPMKKMNKKYRDSEFYRNQSKVIM